MNRRNVILALIAVWVALSAWSFVAYQVTAPTDFGFTRGMNRVTQFFEIQIVAVLVAILAFVLSFRYPARSALRWMARVPALTTLVLIAGFAVLVVVAIWNKPAPSTPTSSQPVTEPVTQ